MESIFLVLANKVYNKNSNEEQIDKFFGLQMTVCLPNNFSTNKNFN